MVCVSPPKNSRARVVDDDRQAERDQQDVLVAAVAPAAITSRIEQVAEAEGAGGDQGRAA